MNDPPKDIFFSENMHAPLDYVYNTFNLKISEDEISFEL